MTDDAENLATEPGEPMPVLLSRGQYSIYQTPDEGLHLVYRPEEAAEDAHIPIPARLLKLAGAAAGGRGPLAMLRAFIPGGG